MFFSLSLLSFSKDQALTVLDEAVTTLLIFVVGFFAIRISKTVLKKIFERSKLDRTIEHFLQSLIIWSLWIVLMLILLSNIGIDIGPILASLSIVGFVTGFALKDVMANLAAGLFILGAKPFKIGDYIVAGSISGTVYKIGIASCVIKTPQNQKITVPNAKIWGEPITNYSAYDTRRMDITLGISYDAKIDKAVKTLNSIARSEKAVLKDKEIFVNVTELSDYSVKVTLRCWTKSDDYWDSFVSINRKIKTEFEKKGIVMPNPTMDINLVGGGDFLRPRK